MRLPFVAFGWLAAALSGAAAQTPTVAEQTSAVTGITVTNAGTYTAQTMSAPARPGQDTPTGTVGTGERTIALASPSSATLTPFAALRGTKSSRCNLRPLPSASSAATRLSRTRPCSSNHSWAAICSIICATEDGDRKSVV